MRRGVLFLIVAACGGASEATDATPLLDAATPLDADTTPAYVWQLPPGFPEPRVPASNPMTAAKVALGRHLFYDKRLSGNQTQACASCHLQAHAFTDTRAVALGSTAEQGRRASMSLTNVAYNPVQTWANNVLVELEQQAIVPIFGERPVELGMAGMEDVLLARLRAESRYATLFTNAYPDHEDPYTIANIVGALAAFERTLISGGSRYDAFVQGDAQALSPAEQRGLEVFNSEETQCHHCHAGFNFTVAVRAENTPPEGFVTYANTGLYNVDGAGAYPSTDQGLWELTFAPSDMGRFRPPTLRNIAVTAPYMHDGSVATLEDVVDHYARGGRLIADGPLAGDGAQSPVKSFFVGGFQLTTEQRSDLVAFLRALTDDEFLSNRAFADPWE